jgi:membrane-associated phospholipid phosphatase
VPCIGLFISTLYLRYHYVIDVIAGAALSLVALRLALGASGRRKGVTTT